MKNKLLRFITMMSKLTLKIAVIQILFLSIAFGSDGLAQENVSVKQATINVGFSDADLSEVIKTIEDKTGYRFIYDAKDLRNKSGFTIESKKRSVEDLLIELSKDYNLHFRQVNNNISVKRGEKLISGKETPVQIIIQGVEITGRVISSEDDEGLPGVNVVVKGTSNGTVTDVEGNYKIEVPDSESILMFSSVGYNPEEILIGNQTVINLSMVPDITQLDELVVIGYGTAKKSDLTGALSSVKGDDLRGTVTATIDQALQGRAAGVQVTQNSGQPGGAVSIRIRGSNSITGSNEPLYVIDGIQFQGDGGEAAGFDWAGGANGQRTISNPLAGINPNDIESIEILKDASATAIYGSRAANGVVIITTKRGKAGDAKISYNGYYAMQDVPTRLDMMKLPEYAEYQYQLSEEIESININEKLMDPSILGPGTDWQDAVFRQAPMQSHQLTVLGGSEKTQFALSGGYFTQDGIVIGSDFERFSTRLNMDSQIKKGVKVGASLSYSMTDETIVASDGGDGVIAQALQMPPNVPVYDMDGNFAGPEDGSAEIKANPVALALMRNNTLARQRIMSNMYLDIDIVKGLKFRSELGFDSNHGLSKAFVPTYEWGPVLKRDVNDMRQREENNFFWLWKNYFTYTYEKNSHNLTAMVGMESQKSKWEGSDVTKNNFASNDIQVLNQGEPNTINGWEGSATLASYYGRFNYIYGDRYYATFTIRADGSSRFGPNNKWGYFPSGSFAWRVINENFMPTSNVLTDLKLRLGYGEVGNQAIPNYAYGSALRSIGNTAMGTTYINQRISNPDLRWESTVQYNIGIDMSFWDGRIDLVADVYKKYTDGLLLELSTPNYLGGGGGGIGAPYVNLGKVENEGLEITLNTKNISTNKFSWDSDFVLTMNRNKITEIDKAYYEGLYWYSDFQTVTRTQAGAPIGLFYGYEVEGIFTSGDDIRNHAVQVADPGDASVNFINQRDGVWLGDVKFKDQNGDGVIDASDQVSVGDPNPTASFGFNNTFSYAGFDLSIYLIGAYGADILNFQRYRNESMVSAYNNQANTVADRAVAEMIDPNGSTTDIDNYQLTNPDTDMPRFSQLNVNGNSRMSDRWIDDGSYLRVQNVSLAYTFPAEWTRKARIERLRLYVNAQNLYTFTNYSGYDPEIGSFDQNPLRQNIDMGRYPLPRVFTIGMDIDF